VKSFLFTTSVVFFIGLATSAQVNSNRDSGGYSKKVHTLCTIKSAEGSSYTVHVLSQLERRWKVHMDLSRVDSRRRSQSLVIDKSAHYMQHTSGESFKGRNMKLEIYYVDVSAEAPTGEIGIFDATLSNGEKLHFERMICAHSEE
jgi:hypothetical protein